MHVSEDRFDSIFSLYLLNNIYVALKKTDTHKHICIFSSCLFLFPSSLPLYQVCVSRWYKHKYWLGELLPCRVIPHTFGHKYRLRLIISPNKCDTNLTFSWLGCKCVWGKCRLTLCTRVKIDLVWTMFELNPVGKKMFAKELKKMLTLVNVNSSSKDCSGTSYKVNIHIYIY